MNEYKIETVKSAMLAKASQEIRKLRAELAEARNKALEEAAARVDRISELAYDGTLGGRTIREEKQALLHDLATSIRRLKSGGA